MRKLILIIIISFAGLSVHAQVTAGTLTVTTTTVASGGNYSPANILAVWIQNSTGAFAKTLIGYTGGYKAYLVLWKTATPTYNTVDAITSATHGSHGTRTCTWNGTNVTGTLLGDGTYTLKMEMTEGGTLKEGTFTFKKGSAAQTITPADISGFSKISITWSPVNTALSDVELDKLYAIYPVPAKTFVYVRGFDIDEIQICSLNGKCLITSKEQRIDIGALPHGVYLANILTKNGCLIKKFLKD